MENTERRLDLSTKFIKMGQSLMEEGREIDDAGIAQIGATMIFMGGLMIGDEEDIFKFSELCSMFSAKKILESMNESKIKSKGIDSTYDELIKKLDELRRMRDSDENEA